jgi:hypothetical protein
MFLSGKSYMIKKKLTVTGAVILDMTRLCPECYVEMKPQHDKEGHVIYHQCPKCGMCILFTHSGH